MHSAVKQLATAATGLFRCCSAFVPLIYSPSASLTLRGDHCQLAGTFEALLRGPRPEVLWRRNVARCSPSRAPVGGEEYLIHGTSVLYAVCGQSFTAFIPVVMIDHISVVEHAQSF